MEDLTLAQLESMLASDDNSIRVSAANELMDRVTIGYKLINMGMYTSVQASDLDRRLCEIVAIVSEAMNG